MNDQKILDDAPKGAIGIKIMDGFYRWALKDGSMSKIYDCETFNDYNQIHRSLVDIKRIAELEKEISQYKAVENWVRCFKINELEAHNLEQQANACDRIIEMATISKLHSPHMITRDSVIDERDDLRSQSKALKEQGKCE